MRGLWATVRLWLLCRRWKKQNGVTLPHRLHRVVARLLAHGRQHLNPNTGATGYHETVWVLTQQGPGWAVEPWYATLVKAGNDLKLVLKHGVFNISAFPDRDPGVLNNVCATPREAYLLAFERTRGS